MKRSQRLARIARLSSTAELVAAQTLARAQQELAQLEIQRRELQNYQAEYLKRMEGVDGPPLNAYEAQKLRVFVQRIGDAVAVMDQRIAGTAQRCARERQRWLSQRQRAETQTDLAARARVSEAARAELSLERAIDDRGAPARSDFA